MNFEYWMKEKVDKVNEFLSDVVIEFENSQSVIYKSMNYSLLSGGKRIRPLLFLSTYEIFRDVTKDIIPFAGIMELIHTYSLIHDDLPAMDNDDYRRGKLSSHKVFGEATAILAGDALLNKAFEIGLEFCVNSVDIKRAVKALSVIARSSGTEGMIGGQVIDMFSNERINNIDELKHMDELKTGAIIKSSAAAGAILGGANETEIDAVESYAHKLGIAFQIIDDVLDVKGCQNKLGKAVGSDKANNKITYLSFLTVKEAEEYAVNLTEKAIDDLRIFDDRALYLTELARYLTKRDN